ncbi:amidohydrolase family protein [Bacillus sp. JJ1533]|uniref:amidohydrolase family protein n=1 Tax=Bacillus sp. JJ1533 TaxID=3122959 RepID=UPI002FFFEC80
MEKELKKKQKVIDIDVHNDFAHPLVLAEYLPEPWRSKVLFAGDLGILVHGYGSPVGVKRRDCMPPTGGPAASDPDYLVKDLIEPFNMEYAILTGADTLTISSLHNPDYTAAICSAYNDYVIEEWLPRHKSFKAAIFVCTLDPQQAAREIDRLAGHPDMVEVLINTGTRSPLGQRQYHPIYEAAHRHGLPVATHIGGEGIGSSAGPTAAGYPSTYLEWHTCAPQASMTHLVSLVCEGVFEKFPDLKVIIKEGGIAWLPHLMWRLDKNYKGLRSEVPWLKRLPSEYIRDHCYFSTQPIEEPQNPKDLIMLLDMIDAENFLLFSSDYPHWDGDVPTEILKLLRQDARNKIFYENAKKVYNL